MGCAHIFQACRDQDCPARSFWARFTPQDVFFTPWTILDAFYCAWSDAQCCQPLLCLHESEGQCKQLTERRCLYSPVLLSSFVFDASSSFMSTINTVLFHVCHFSKLNFTVFTILHLFFIYKAVQEHCQFTLSYIDSFQRRKSIDICYFLSWTYKCVFSSVCLPMLCLQCLN